MTIDIKLFLYYNNVMGKLVDMSNKKFGQLTVIDRNYSKRNNSFAYWNCICTCGNKVVVNGSSLRLGNTKSCGKCLGIDETGNTYGKLTVLYKSINSKKYKQSGAIWVCRCECGNVIERRGSFLRRGGCTSCGCSWLENVRKSNSLPKGQAAKNHILKTFKKSATKRGISWELSDELVLKIITKNCYYCGREPFQVIKRKTQNWTLTYMGLDRINNDLGYTLNNVVPCCKICNYAKSNYLLSEFLEWIRCVYSNSITT